jgi:spore coat protein U-like protein
VNAALSLARRVLRLAPVRHACAAMLLMLGSAEALAAADCTVSAVGVNFGVYDPFITTPDDSVGEITVTCTHVSGPATDVRYTLTLSTGGSGSYLPRRLRAGSALLAYNLWSNATQSSIWGNGSSGTVIITGSMKVGPGVGNEIRSAVHPIYGRIPALQDAAEDDFLDSIVATLTY